MTVGWLLFLHCSRRTNATCKKAFGLFGSRFSQKLKKGFGRAACTRSRFSHVETSSGNVFSVEFSQQPAGSNSSCFFCTFTPFEGTQMKGRRKVYQYVEGTRSNESWISVLGLDPKSIQPPRCPHHAIKENNHKIHLVQKSSSQRTVAGRCRLSLSTAPADGPFLLTKANKVAKK